MALVGEAHIVVRAITDKVDRDIQRAFNNVSSTGRRAGESMGAAFTRGFNRNANANTFSRLTDALRTLAPGAEAARKAFQNLLGTGYALQAALSAIVPAVFSLIGGLGALGGAAGGAIGVLASLGNVLFTLGAAMAVARLALGGIGRAVTAINRGGGGGGGGGGGSAASTARADAAAAQAAARAREAAARAIEDAERSLARTIEQSREDLLDANNDVRDAQLSLNEALKAGREEIQQLGFDAEDAALNEQKAALDLERAREALARVQDLPPNSRVRREAELAYQEAELNLRKAMDRSSDLNAEQDRLAKTGVRGTNVVINATNALAEAEAAKARTVRDSLRSEEDALRALEDARRQAAEAAAMPTTSDAGDTGSSGGGGGGVDPLEGLNDAQRQFALFIAGLKPKFDELKAAATDSFLPLLQTAIQTIVDGAWPTLVKGVGEIGNALGLASISIADAIVRAANLEKLASLFTSSAALLVTMGQVAGNVYGILLSILNATAPMMQRFFDYLNAQTAAFDAWLNTTEGNTALTDFFARAEATAKQFGDIFGNIFDTIGGVIMANMGPGTGGGYLLTWIQEVTQRWADFNNSLEGQNALKDYFLDVSVNAQSVLQAIGSFFDIFVDLAANPAIKETFDILKSGAPAMRELVTAGLEAAPSLATLLKTLTEFFAKIADTGAIQVFFDTLNGVFSFLSGLLDNELVAGFVEVHGRIIAFTAAFGILGQIGGFAFKVLAGGIMNIVGPIGAAISGFQKISQALAFATYSSSGLVAGIGRVGSALLGALTGPVGIVLGIIALLVGAFIALYNTNEEFAAQMDAVWGQITAVFTEAFGTIMAAVQPIIPVLVGAFQTLMTSLAPVITLLATTFASLIVSLVPVITLLVTAFGQIVTAVAPLIPMLLGALIPALVSILSAVIPLIANIIGALVPAFTAIIGAVMPVVTMLIDLLVPVITMLIEALLPLITTLIDALMPAFTAILEAVMPLITQLAEFLVPVIEVLAEVLGFLIPIIIAVVEVIINVLIAVITFLVETITNFITDWEGTWQQIFDFVVDIWNNIASFFTDVWNNIVNFFVAGFTAYVGFWVGLWNNIWNTVSTIWNNISNFVRGVVNNVINFFVGAFNGLLGFWNGFWGGFGSVVNSAWSGILGFVRGVVNGIISTVEGMVNAVARGINGMISGLNTVLGGVGQAIGINLKVGNVPTVSLPRMADGGTVFPSRGGSIVNVAEAGRPERIEPLDADGLSKRDRAMIEFLAGGRGGGTTINVYALPGQDVNEIAEEVSRRISFNMRKGATV